MQPLRTPAKGLCHLIRNAAVLAFGLCLLTACRSGARDNETAMRCEITPQPARVGSANVVVNLTDPSGSPIDGASIRIDGFMTHPGMAPVLRTATRSGPGQYSSPFDFTMAGDWVLRIHASLPGGGTLERQFEVKGVAAQ